MRITLTDGTTIDAALLVGCDGIFSTVRRLLALPGDCLQYVGLVVVLGIVEDESRASRKLTQRRIFETVDGTTRIYAMPFTPATTMWQLSFPCPEAEAKRFARDTAALKAEIERRCQTWHAPIPELLARTDLDNMSGYPVYDRPVLEPHVLRPAPAPGQPSPPRRVTIIGDAAHPMTPFKAQGANQALSDAVLLADTLAEAVCQHGPAAGIDHALPVFERKMLSRANRVVVGSREKAREMHSTLALQPARKVQRDAADAALDMRHVIRLLRHKGIGAACARDARGLDAVVAASMDAAVGGAEVLAPEAEGGGGGGGGGGGERGGGLGGEEDDGGAESRQRRRAEKRARKAAAAAADAQVLSAPPLCQCVGVSVGVGVGVGALYMYITHTHTHTGVGGSSSGGCVRAGGFDRQCRE